MARSANKFFGKEKDSAAERTPRVMVCQARVALLMTDDENLKAALNGIGVKCSDASSLGEVNAMQIRNQVDAAGRRVDGESARTLERRQILDYGVGVSIRVLLNDGEAAVAAAIGGID